MTDFMMPDDLVPAQVRWSSIDSTATFAADTIGAVRSSEIVGGSALAPTFRWPTLKDQVATALRRSRAIASLRRLRGQANRLWLPIPVDPHHGSFAAPELLGNHTFAASLSGWTTSGTEIALGVTDRVLRCTRTSGATTRVVAPTAAATVVPFAPYCLRAMINKGCGTLAQDVRLGASAGGVEYARSAPNSQLEGLITIAGVPYAASAWFSVSDSVVGASKIAGDYWESPYFSLSRCLLVDNGKNALQFSVDYSDAAWTKTRASVAATPITLPDGSTGTTNVLHEDATAANTHRLEQAVTVSSAVQDIMVACAVKAINRNWVALSLFDTAFGTAFFNVAAGAVGTIAGGGIGTDWADPRSFIVNLGNGWWYCALVARHIGGGTSVRTDIYPATGDLGNSFDGLNQDSLGIWRSTLAQSSVPSRLVQTTTAALPTGVAQSGTLLHVKGAPPSAAGLLRVGKWLQLGREPHQVATNLDSDAAGLGVLQLCRGPRNAPADNDPVIVTNPMGKYLQAKNVLDWVDRPGGLTDLEVEFLEATAG